MSATTSITVVVVAAVMVLFAVTQWIAIALPMLRAPRQSVQFEAARSVAIAIGPAMVWGAILLVLPWQLNSIEMPFLLVPTPVAVFMAPALLGFFAALAYRLSRSPDSPED